MKKPEIIQQQDQTDCGVACLLSLVKYYDGTNSLENLRRLSGTGISGTTMLGLYQAARQIGFDANGCKADIPALIQHNEPCILHVVTEQQLQHYIVCFETFEKKGHRYFVIGDPAAGIVHMSADELAASWQSNTCLVLKPNHCFVKKTDVARQKKNWIVQLIKDDLQLLMMALILGLGIAILGVAMSLFSQKLLDDILPKRNPGRLNAGMALVVLLLIAREVLLYLRQLFLLRQAKDFSSRIIQYFFTHLLHLPKSFFDARKTGEFTARLNDTSRIQRVISQLAGNVVIDGLIILTSIIFIFSYSWQVGIATVLFMPVLYFIVYRKHKRISAGQRAVMANYAQTESNYISTIQGIDPVKNFNKKDVYSSGNASVYSKYQASVLTLGKIQISLSFAANSCGVLFLTGILFYTSHQVINGHMKAGELIALLGICSSLLPSVGSLALITIPVSEAKIAFDRMFEFTSLSPESTEKDAASFQVNTISLQHISFRFAGRSQLLKKISFELKRGEITAVMGENGCGKSTLTGILQKHYEAETGSIIINSSFPLDSVKIHNWRNICTVVPQHPHIFDGTVLENIAFEKAATHQQEVLRFIKDYGFHIYLDALPQGVFTHVGDRGINLSGGQQQMIVLARALFHTPQVLILDEATSAMDRNSERFVLHLLQQLKSRMAILFITHRLHLLKLYSDNILILEDGNICTYGTHEKLLQGTNLYSQYWADISTQ